VCGGGGQTATALSQQQVVKPAIAEVAIDDSTSLPEAALMLTDTTPLNLHT